MIRKKRKYTRRKPVESIAQASATAVADPPAPEPANNPVPEPQPEIKPEGVPISLPAKPVMAVISKKTKKEKKHKPNAFLWYHPENTVEIAKEKTKVIFTYLEPVPGQKMRFLEFSFSDKTNPRIVYLWKQEKNINQNTGEITFPNVPYEPVYSGTCQPTRLYQTSDWAPAKRYLTIAKKWQDAIKLGAMGLMLFGTLFALMMVIDMAGQKPPGA